MDPDIIELATSLVKHRRPYEFLFLVRSNFFEI